MNALIVVFLLMLDYPGIIRFEARLSGFEEDYPVWIIRAHPGGNRIIKTPAKLGNNHNVTSLNTDIMTRPGCHSYNFYII